MSKLFETNIDLDQNEIKNVVIDSVAVDIVAPIKAQTWFNTVTNLWKWFDGTVNQIVASQAYVTNAIAQLGQIQGIFSALAGALPTIADKTQGDLTAIKKGDFWVISVAGTIAGIQGADELSIGDIIQFYGTTPATASDWLGVQRNLNDTLVGTSKTERQIVTLVANTPLNVNAATLTDIFSVQTYNSAGTEISLDLQKLGAANQITLTSKKALVNINVDMVGAS